MTEDFDLDMPPPPPGGMEQMSGDVEERDIKLAFEKHFSGQLPHDWPDKGEWVDRWMCWKAGWKECEDAEIFRVHDAFNMAARQLGYIEQLKEMYPVAIDYMVKLSEKRNGK